MGKYLLMKLLANFAVDAIKFTEVSTIRMGYRLLDPETIYFYVSVQAVECLLNSVFMYSNGL